MLKKFVCIFICAVIVICLAPVNVFAAPAVSVPGGEVRSYDDLIAALGGTDHLVVKTDDNGKITHLLLMDNLELASPVEIKEGEYVIFGAGMTFTASFESGSFFEVTGEETSLTVGNPDGSTSTDTVFDGKGKTIEGSFIFVGAGAAVMVNYGTEMKDTVTSVSGGAIYSEGDLLINGAKFTKCRALGSGGAIFTKGELVIGSAEAKDCSAEYGGVLYSMGKTSVLALTAESCIATDGGAIFNAGEMKYYSATVTSCSAKHGGAVYNSGTCEILGGSVKECAATDGQGGAVYNCGTLTVSGGNFDSNTAHVGGTIYNDHKLITGSNMMLYAGKAEAGGNIYNTADGEIELAGGSISLGKATYGGGIFNLGYIKLIGSNIHANKGDVGKGVLNHGTVEMSKNGYVDPNNDFFVVLSENNEHALVINEGWTYDKQTVMLSCGIAVDDGYVYDEKLGDVLIKTDYEYDLNDRFGFFNGGNFVFADDGSIAKAPASMKALIYVLTAIVAFAAVVTAIVIPVRYLDKKKASTVSADDYF